MRILLLNDTTLRAGLEKRGYEVRACGPEARYLMPDQSQFDFTFPSRTVIALEAVLARLEGWQPELIIHTEIHTNYFYRGIERAPCPTIWRTIDNHIHGWQPRYSPTHDLVLVAQKDHLTDFLSHHPFAFWLPLNSFPQVHFARGLERDVPVSFVGSLNPEMHPERARFFEALRQRIPVEVQAGIGQEQLSQLYNRSKVVVNQCVHLDLNYRVFEAMANGAMLLTPRIQNGLLELFGEGKELVTYPPGDVEEATRLLHYYLSHEQERAAIAQAGQAAIERSHTLEHRLDQILTLVKEVIPAAHASREARLSGNVWAQLFPLYAALHSQRYTNAELALDALRGLAEKGALLDAIASATRVAIEHLDGGRPSFAEPYLELAFELGAQGAVEGLLGRVRMSQGRLEEAHTLLESAVATAGSEPAFWLWLAQCRDEAGQRHEAVAALEKCLELQPGRSEAVRMLQRLQNPNLLLRMS